VRGKWTATPIVRAVKTHRLGRREDHGSLGFLAEPVQFSAIFLRGKLGEEPASDEARRRGRREIRLSRGDWGASSSGERAKGLVQQSRTAHNALAPNMASRRNDPARREVTAL